MESRLIVMAGPLAGGAPLSLTQVETSVGRDHANDVALADGSVSPRHCLLVRKDDRLMIRDLDAGNPSFVNGLPAGSRTLQSGDELQIGGSLFVVLLSDTETATSSEAVGLMEGHPLRPATIVVRREDVFADAQFHSTVPAGRLARDLAALIRASAAINAVQGLVALKRPLMELIADVVPAARGALIVSGNGPDDIQSAVGWRRGSRSDAPVQVSRPIVDRVLRDIVGVLTYVVVEAGVAGGTPDGPGERSVLAAPLVAFDKLVGAIVLEADGADSRFDEGHLRLLMAIASVAATSFEYARQVESLEGLNRRLRAAVNLEYNMVGESGVMRDVYRRIARVAPTDSTVLITGESGTGKELVARAIHRNSPRQDRPFVAINCAAITETLLESELFGHEKGAFTGAIAQKKGKLEIAEGGTVFLDEIGELSIALQAKLLRVLQDREFERVGGTTRVRVDFRLVAATNRDLKAAIDGGAFRRDLYYRLNVVSLAMPALRERRDDILLLASWFLRRHMDKAKRQVAGFSAEAQAAMTAYEWPGNVRELENAVEHAVVLGQDSLILADDLPEVVVEAAAPMAAPPSPPSVRFHEVVKQTKKDLILRAVDEAGGNYNAAARLLGLHPNYLHRLVTTLQLRGARKDS